MSQSQSKGTRIFIFLEPDEKSSVFDYAFSIQTNIAWISLVRQSSSETRVEFSYRYWLVKINSHQEAVYTQTIISISIFCEQCQTYPLLLRQWLFSYSQWIPPNHLHQVSKLRMENKWFWSLFHDPILSGFFSLFWFKVLSFIAFSRKKITCLQ